MQNMGMPGMGSVEKELTRDPFGGIECIHPDFIRVISMISDIQKLREYVFSKKDPHCLRCGFKCNCLSMFLKPEVERRHLSARTLYDPNCYLCQNCHVKEECFANNAILKKPVSGWVEENESLELGGDTRG